MTIPIAIAANDNLVSRYLLRQVQEHLPEGYSLELILHETTPYPWKARYNQFMKKAFPNFVRGALTNPYWRLPFLERRAYALEKTLLFGARSPSLPEGVERLAVERIHDKNSIEMLKKHNIKVLFIMGILPVSAQVLAEVPESYGLYFGALPTYAGLHGQIWAAARGDADGLVVTLHRLSPNIGTGEIVSCQSIGDDPRLSLIALRALSVLRLSQMLIELLTHRNTATQETPATDGEGEGDSVAIALLPPASLWTRWRAAVQLSKWAKDR